MFCYTWITFSHFSCAEISNLAARAKCPQKLQIIINIFTRTKFILQSEFELGIRFDILHEIEFKIGYTVSNVRLYFNSRFASKTKFNGGLNLGNPVGLPNCSVIEISKAKVV
jgi:hypothetical protein